MCKDITYQCESRGGQGNGFQRHKILRLPFMDLMAAKALCVGTTFSGLSHEFCLPFACGSNLGHTMLVGIAYHPGHAGKSGNLLRGTLGIAARYHDLCQWIFTMDSPNRGASVLIGSGG